jgi:uncharacterized protein (DUF305 family)
MPIAPRVQVAALGVASLVLSLSSLALAGGAGPPGTEAAFLAENDAAMTTMMAGMRIKPSGDVDRDFVDMMVPHHQGAIDMAVAVLRYGHNEKVRRLAQEIIVTQQQEIAAMRLAVGEPAPPSLASPTTPVPGGAQMPGMEMKLEGQR